MPFINVKTNVSASADLQETIKTQLGEAITAIPGKSEAWLMGGIQPDYALWFKGESSPAAMVEVSIFGGASPSDYNRLTEMITAILNSSLEIPPNRIYVKYSETENWGWNGSDF